MRSLPSALARSSGAMVLFGPVPTHDLATSPWPPCSSCLSRSLRPPLSTLPVEPPPSRLPRPPCSRPPSPPGNPPASPPPPGTAVPPAGAPCWLPVTLLIALKASRPNNAIVSGDMPPWPGVVCPRGPFCMPLSTSISPISASSKRSAHQCAVSPAILPQHRTHNKGSQSSHSCVCCKACVRRALRRLSGFLE